MMEGQRRNQPSVLDVPVQQLGQHGSPMEPQEKNNLLGRAWMTARAPLQWIPGLPGLVRGLLVKKRF